MDRLIDHLSPIYQPPLFSLLVPYLPHTAFGRMISSFLFQIARFPLDLSLCAPVVSTLLALDIAHSFTSRTGSDWTGLDWTLSPSPPHGIRNSTISYLLVVISPRAC